MTASGDRRRPREAAALCYERGRDAAPEVVARGAGEVAERIVARAREAGVPVREDGELVGLLAQCELGEAIPLELYHAVAEILSYLYGLERELDESG